MSAVKFIPALLHSMLLLHISWLNFHTFTFTYSWRSRRDLEGYAHMDNFNFLTVDLRDDFVSRDFMQSMKISNVLCNTKLLVSTNLKIIDHKLQYYIGREFLLLFPLAYKM